MSPPALDAQCSGSLPAAEFGVYVHIPFCASKCDYCAFATWTDRQHLVDDYLDALLVEVRTAVAAGLPTADTVFVGGGTPSLVPPRRLVEVLAAVPTASDAEVTVECNPDDVTPELLGVYLDGGVNRVSLGVQSMASHVLRALGRTHDQANVARAVDAVHRAGLTSFNLDLIYGAAGETVDDWEQTLRSALACDPPHVSAYGLTVEQGTPLATQPDRHPDDDDQADKYELADELLTAGGLSNYEVSNWARPDHESRHNSLYWRQRDYRGFGCAAHSHAGGQRWWNVRTPDRYVDLVRRVAPVEAASETLDADARRVEGLQLLLRTREGVPAAAFDRVDLDELSGLLVTHPVHRDRVVLTRAGRLLANEVSLRLR